MGTLGGLWGRPGNIFGTKCPKKTSQNPGRASQVLSKGGQESPRKAKSRIIGRALSKPLPDHDADVGLVRGSALRKGLGRAKGADFVYLSFAVTHDDRRSAEWGEAEQGLLGAM